MTEQQSERWKKINAKPNQRVIITILDEFVPSENITEEKGMRGILSDYADPALAEKEKGAWENVVVKKYGNT